MSQGTVLVADDDRAIRTVLDQALGRAGYDVRTTSNAATLWRWITEGEGDLVITDVVMPDENGLDLLPRIKKIRPDLPIIVMSAQTTLLTAIKATERGAFEYLPKPFDLRELTTVVQRGLSTARERRKAEPRTEEAEESLPLIGRSPSMQDIYRTLARLMQTDLTVMITGESGTGKELVARALHDYGRRRNGPFVPVNMAAIPRDLIESELFGHERGAFTAASARGPINWAPYFACSAELPPLWSPWGWVVTICVSRQPRAARAASTGAASPGSTTAVAPVPASCSR